ncbi:hypothetical protein [Croceicoccus mobilis]|uniref:MarR family transcriptional regulator n=1 Tax=Croceicoccus mobilis TaxID=1703339 RepID=A0A917DSC8_9SPHN|nr:hypothetical protein [Croceicoccus mobilis]GGD65491.1 hypothetical protein GCM10010990_13730 [Croceicoccus mobilis]
MSHIAAPFVYDQPDENRQPDSKVPNIPVSILADRPAVRNALMDQVLDAGLMVRQAEPLDKLLTDEALVLGDLVIIDLPVPGAELLAALARLDMRAGQSGTQLIVATRVEGIDAVFGAMDSAGVQFLVDPKPAEYALAIGAALARLPGRSVHEMTHEDHLALVRLTEQVHSLARRIGGIGGAEMGAGLSAPKAPSAVNAPNVAYMARAAEDEAVQAHGELPNAGHVREIIRQRQLRANFFDSELFADPAWDMLLDLTAARAEGQDVCVSSLCIASGVPPTTALRWIGQMTEAGLFERLPDPADRRRAIIRLSRKAENGMAAYFSRVGTAPMPI